MYSKLLQPARSIGQFAAVMSIVVSASCATSPASLSGPLNAWATPEDCFSREVTAAPANAEAMALACAGPEGAADPARSGIDRAAAYFNAAAALNVLAAQETASDACDSPASCHEFAIRLLEKSYLNQEDAFVPSSRPGALSLTNEHFKLRRALELAKALRGAAGFQSKDASCGEPGECLAAADSALATYDLETLAADKSGMIAASACEALGVVADINLSRGHEHEFSAITNLRRIERLCPASAAQASLELAQIAFSQGEQLRRSLEDSLASKTSGTDSIHLAVSALSSYRDALHAPSLKLPAYRAIGSVSLQLAALEPSSAPAHIGAAIDAFNAAQQLSIDDDAEAHSEDLTLLGLGYLQLAEVQRPQTATELDTLVNGAIRTLSQAVSLAPTYSRWLALGDALAQGGRNDDAKAAYAAALALAEPSGGETALLALSALHEKTGTPDAALALLEKAAASGSPAARIRYEIGRLRFLKGDYSGALQALPDQSDELGKARIAESHYMTSIAESILRRPGWQDRARAHADEAVMANSSAARYIRQDCLAHIQNAGADVKSGASLNRCPIDDTPEKFLLRGMYFLKQAQLIDISAYDAASVDHWRSVLRLSEDSFRSGREAYANAAAGKRHVRFDDLARDIDVGLALDQGLKVIGRCRRDITIEEDSPAWDELSAFFGHYGVLKCSSR